MASHKLETASAAAATALPELRLYHLGCKGVSLLATLQLCSPVPVELPHDDAPVDGLLEDEDAPVEQGFYLAVLEGGALVAVGRLSSLDGRQFGSRASSCEKPLLSDDQEATTVAADLDGSDEETSQRGIFANLEDTSEEDEEEEDQEQQGDTISMEEDTSEEEEEGEEEEGDETSEEEGQEEEGEEEGELTSEEEEQVGQDSSDDDEGRSDKRRCWGQGFLFGKWEDGSHEETSEEEQEGENTSMEEESSEESSAVLSLEEEEQDGQETSQEEEQDGEETTHDDDGSDKSSEEDHGSKNCGRFLQLRICPGKSHVTLAFFDGGCWSMTKSYSLKWLSCQHKMEVQVLDMIKEDIAGDVTVSKATASSSALGECFHWLKGCMVMLEFGGPLFYPDQLEEALRMEVNPTSEDFKIIKRLGKGVSGKVHQCVYKDSHIHEPYAVKIIKLSKSDDIDAYHNKEPREVSTISSLIDPKIVRFYKAWKLSKGCKSNMQSDGSESHPLYVAIQMEYCVRTLENMFCIGEHQVNVEHSWSLFQKITQSLALIHEKGIVHRDIKLSNILVGEDGEVKVGDFGHACWAEWYRKGHKGTPERGTGVYVAPELDRGQVTDKVDIYSLGVIFMEIFSKFGSGMERYEVLRDLKFGHYPTEFLGDIMLLKELTASSPSDRPSAVNIMEYLDGR